ncbi:DUF541 domain-containing protein [SAR202 cluster bacterium AD-802-E10_MRT_200m]|nr:DUF541 domain-containing protein [SAR202 cluster bacterium AD-802-E10_MRT_200m]
MCKTKIVRVALILACTTLFGLSVSCNNDEEVGVQDENLQGQLIQSADVGQTSSPLRTANGSTLISSNQQFGIWVTGTGKVFLDPNIAVITMGVESQSETVSVARTKAAKAMNAVIQVIQKADVRDEDVQTQYYNVSPVYSYKDVTGSSGYPIREQVLTGYKVTNKITVTLRDIDRVGDILDNSIDAGGKFIRINGIEFTASDFSTAELHARELAVKDALAKAQQFAELTNVAVGDLTFVTEAGSSPGFNQMSRSFESAAMMMDSTPISTGQIEAEIRVEAVFTIK